MSNPPNKADTRLTLQNEELIRSREPAHGPVYTRGNAFWKGHQRFLIKGINYLRKRTANGGKPRRRDPSVDVLADESLDILMEDIKVLCELGLNTVLVSELDHNKNHRKAMEVLAEAGFYVLVTLQVQDITSNEGDQQVQVPPPDPEADMQPYYAAETVAGVLRIVDELADCPNMLGFIVSGQRLNMPTATRTAEVMRAGVRDIKFFLGQRGGKYVSVGVSQPHSPLLQEFALQYFTAGDRGSRIDFWALECYSWAHRSSFEISGWKSLVAACERFPVPMFLSEFGAKVGKIRIWQKIGCLYSPDMTGVFCGGCLYTYFENGNGYGIVDTDEHGNLVPKSGTEFETLKRRFRSISKQTPEQTYPADREARYEEWVGEYPERQEGRWYALGDKLPQFPLEWVEFMQEIWEDNQWELVERASDVGLAGAVDDSEIDS